MVTDPSAIHIVLAALDQWERELRLFGSLKALRIFRLYKIWKVSFFLCMTHEL
jgi:hypothetical protein